MTTPTNEEITARRQTWVNAALADPLLAPERRCYGAYFQIDLSAGQQTNCYVGVGFLASLPSNVIPELDLRLDMITGHIIQYARNSSVSRETRKFYGLDISSLNELINMSDQGLRVESINEYMVNCPIAEEAQ